MSDPVAGARSGRRRVPQRAAVPVGALRAAPSLLSVRDELPIKIGVVDEMTGPASMLGISEHQDAAREGLVLPPEIALQPGEVFYRLGDHQLVANILVGEIHPPPKGGNKYDVFTAHKLVPGQDVAGTAAENGCHMT